MRAETAWPYMSNDARDFLRKLQIQLNKIKDAAKEKRRIVAFYNELLKHESAKEFEYVKKEIEELMNGLHESVIQKKSLKEFAPKGMNELLAQLEEAKKQGIIVDYDMVDPLEAYVFISDLDYATVDAVEEIFDTFDKFKVVEDPNWPAPSSCKAFSIARL